MKKRLFPILMAVLMMFAVMPVTSFAADGSYSNDSGIGAEGSTPHHIKWTLYHDGTLYLYPDSDVGTKYLEAGDDTWAGEIYYQEEADDSPVPVTPPPISVTGKEMVRHLVVADRIGNIDDSMFKQYPNLESVILSGNIEIEQFAFSTCPILETVTVNGSITSIGKSAFGECEKLKTFTVDGTVGSIANEAFNNDSSLTGFDAPVTGDIGTFAFYNCANLAKLSPIRGNAGNLAFDSCSNLKDVYVVSGHTVMLGNTGPAFNNNTIIRYTGTEEEFQNRCTVIIPDGATYQYQYQCIGDNIYWTRDDNGVIRIIGSGKTIDLLDAGERPWLDNYNKLVIHKDVELGNMIVDSSDPRVCYGETATVNNGSGGGPYEENEIVTITANEAPAGQRFKEWTGVDGLTFTSGSATTEEAAFRMPDRDVTLTATYEKSPHAVTVIYGTGSDDYYEGDMVTINALPPAGQRFKEWTGVDGLTFISGSATTKEAAFWMPGRDVTVRATFEDNPSHTVTVENGTGSGTYREGVFVTITADEAPAGQRFKEWTGIDGLTLGYGSATTKLVFFRMPNRDVTVRATYEDNPSHTVTVENGTGSGTYRESTAVTITADEAPAGQQFKAWTGADELTFTSGSASSAIATFTMPTNAVTLTATYEYNPAPPAETFTVTFKAGGGIWTDGTTEDKQVSVEKGKAATAPEDPTREGYTFDGWDTDFNSVTSDLTVTATWAENPIPPQPAETFMVTFKAGGGVWTDGTTEDKQVSVEKGKAATAPEEPERDGFTFNGWDTDFNSVTSYLTVTATWAENPIPPQPAETFMVTFKAGGGVWTDGTTEDKQVSVEKGKAATAPEEPERDGFTFNGWDTDFNSVTSDLTVTAKWTENPTPPQPQETFTVTFKAGGGVWTDGTTEDKQVSVEKGKAATAPEDPERDGYTFNGWDTDFNSVTSDLTVTATWKENTVSPQPTEPTEEEKATAEARAALSSTIADVQKIEKGSYTDDSWNALQAAIAEADALAKDKKATAAQLKAAADKVAAARVALKEKPAAPEPQPEPEPVVDPTKEMGADGTAFGKGASAVAAEKAITSQKNDNDPKGSAFAPLMLKSTKQGKTNISLTWKKATGAKKYVIYGNACGKKQFVKITTTNKLTYNVKKINKKALKKATYHKFIVVALDSKGKVVTTSKVIHVATKGKGNPTKVTVSSKVKKNKLSLKGKTVKLAGKAVGKKVTQHVKVRYESSNPKIAKVDSKGAVKGLKKGKCKIYAYAQNGVCTTISVSVKVK